MFFCALMRKKRCQNLYGKPFKYRIHFMKSICEDAEVKPFGFHAIRHLTASTLFSLGYDLGTIQTILRHKSPSTTERYLKSIGLERVRDALEELEAGRLQDIGAEASRK
jgi:integrase